MANTVAIKRRIGSVKNTRQITKAMQLVAASRMRKAQEAAHASRQYNVMARSLLTRLSQLTDIDDFVLFTKQPVKARLLIIITSDSGLAGAYNSNALRRYMQEVKADRDAGHTTYTICIGKKAAQMVARLKGVQVAGVYRNISHDPSVVALQPILRSALQMFTDGTVQAVDVIYTHYYSSMRQEPALLHFLPAGFAETQTPDELSQAEFEPSIKAVLDATTRRLLEAQLLQAVLEAVASEQSMRMMAMKNATDNANDLVDDLSLAYNNARQASITQELAEITGGAEAMR